MADEHTNGQPTNGTKAPPARVSREQLLADLTRGVKPDLTLADDAGAAATPAPKAAGPSVLDLHPEHGKPGDDADADADGLAPEAAAAAGADAAADAETELEADAEVDPDLEDDAKPEPKRLAAIQKYEKRVRAELDAERVAVRRERDEMRAEMAAQRAKLEKFERAVAAAKYDPAGLLAELGYGDDDWEPASQSLYARSKAAAADPKWKAQSEQVQRQREQNERMAAMQRRLDALEEERKTERAQAETQREIDRYLDGVARVVADDAPLMKRLLAKNPDKARLLFFEAARELAQKTGEAPTAKATIAAAERARRHMLEELDIDVTPYTKPGAGKPAPAGNKPTPAAAAATGDKPKPNPRSPEFRSQLIKDLETGNLS